MASHKELRELMFICLHARTITTTTTTLSVSIPTLVRGITTILNNFQYVSFIRYSNEKGELKTQN